MTVKRQGNGEVVVSRAWWRGTFVVVLLLILYLSLKPSLPAELDSLFRDWMGRWSAVHDILANVLAFGLLALSALNGFVPAGRAVEAWRATALLSVGVVLFATTLELVQRVFLPTRSCDWHDIASAVVGAGLALIFYVRKRLPNDTK